MHKTLGDNANETPQAVYSVCIMNDNTQSR